MNHTNLTPEQIQTGLNFGNQTPPPPSITQNTAPTTNSFGGFGGGVDNDWGGLGQYLPEGYNPANNINPNDSDYASKTYAELINQQYEDYRNRFLPYEQRLMSLADSSEMLDQQLGRLTTNVNRSYDSLGQQQKINNERYGISNTAAQTQSQDRSSNLNRALSMAHGENNTRIANADRQNNILTGSSAAQQNFKNMGG